MDQEAVSSIISAVLVLTLFTAAFGVWTVETLPEWIGERENAHANDISDAMGGAMSDILAASNAGRGSQVSLYLSLAPEKIPLVQAAQASGELEVIDGFAYALNAPDHAVVMSGGAMTTNNHAATAVDNVASLLALEWKVTGAAELHAVARCAPTPPAVTCSPTYTATDYIRAHTSACSSGVRTITIYVEASPARTTPIVCSGTDVVDLTQDAIRFDAFLDTTQAAVDIGAWDGSDVTDATVAAAWTDTAGRPHTTAAAASAGPWAESGTDLKSILYSPSYHSIDDREVLMEAGAVIHQQGDLAAMATPPSLVLGATSTEGSLRWAMVVFDGEGNVGGSSSAKATYAITSTSDRVLRIPSGGATDTTLTMTSRAPSAWANGWADAATLAGVSSSYFATSVAGSDATLTLKSSIPWTIHLTIVHVDVRVT